LSEYRDDLLDTADALMADGRADEAAALLGKLVEQGRGGLHARIGYGQALVACRRPDEALALARETALLYPGTVEAALGLGEVLYAAEQLPAAIAELQRALSLDPDCGQARFLMGCAWLEAGEAGRALQAFSALDPAAPGVSDRIAAAEAMAARPRSDAGYVRHLFDQFAVDYDARMLSHLAYRAPAILRELADLVMPARNGLVVLDLGCGTGLTGAAFADRAGRLDGIDLSPAMIEKARARAIYAQLKLADIEDDLGEAVYDLVLAADTLVYLGDLAPVMRRAAAALKAGGFFLFTVEAGEGEGFALGPKRRWRHSQSYLRALAGGHGFEVVGLLACVPRREAREAVNGYAVALRRCIG